MPNLSHTRKYLLLKNSIKRVAPGRFSWSDPIDDTATSSMRVGEPRDMAWPPGVARPTVGLVADADTPPYWTKHRRFLEANQIPHWLCDIHRSDWRSGASEFDAVLWRPMSFPYELEECRRKFWFLENALGKIRYPSLAEALIYEDKILQYELLAHLGFPVVPTFISHSEEEALEYAASTTYPAVWKITCGAGSLGVELVKDERAAARSGRTPLRRTMCTCGVSSPTPATISG